VLKPSKEDGIKEIIRQNKEVFIAENWNIGCTRLVKHHIVTKGILINIKPWRQHLEDKIIETIKILIDNGIIKKTIPHGTLRWLAYGRKENKK